MANPATIRRDGSARLIPENAIKDLCDLGDALLNVEVVPAGAGELQIKGKKAILRIPPGGGAVIEDVIIVFNGTGYRCTLHGTVGDAI